MCSRLNVVETHPRRRGSLSQGSVPSFFALGQCGSQKRHYADQRARIGSGHL